MPGALELFNQQNSKSYGGAKVGSSRTSNLSAIDYFASQGDPELRKEIVRNYAQRDQRKRRLAEEGFRRGMSFEDIAAQTGQDVGTVSSYANETRPGYGVQPTKGIISKGGDVVKTIGKTLYSPVDQTTRLFARTAGAGRETEGQQKATQSLDATREAVIRALNDPNVPAGRKQSLLGLLNEEARSTVLAETERRKQIEQDVGVKQNLGAAAELASYAIGGTGLKAAYKAGGKAAAAKAVTQTAVSGAIGGGGAAAQQQDSTLGDIAKGAGIGAGFGAGLAVGGTLVGAGGKAVGKKITNAVPTISETKLGTAVARTKTAQKITNLKDEFVAKVVDDTNYIKKQFGKNIDKDTGRLVRDELEDRITNVRQFASKAQARLEDNQSFQSLKPLIGGDKAKYDDLANFIKQKQNAINKNKLISSGQRKGAKAAIPVGTAEQEQAYKLLNQATKDDVQYLFDNGIIDNKKYKQWISDPDYTRVQREVLDDQATRYGQSGLAGQKSVTSQKLKGSTKEAVDPFAAYEDWQRRVTLDVERNDLAKYIRDQAVLSGKSNKIQTTSKAYERIKQLYGEEGVQQKTLGVLEDGIKELYTIDPRAARQLAGATDLELKAISNVLLAPSRLLREGATSLNAAFAVPNFVRDQIESAIVSQNARATHNPIAFWGGFKEAVLKPTANATLRKVPGVSDDVFKPSALFKEYLKRNGNMTKVDLARNLKQATTQSLEDLGVKGENVLRRYENIISATEKSTRFQNFLGTYKNAIKKGVSEEQALNIANSAARRNSINFATRGELATFMKMFNPYFNASVQGAANIGRAIKRRPVATSMKIGATILAPTAISTYYNMDSPEKAALYANIPDYVREKNFIFVRPGGNGYFKIPMPPGVSSFANPLRNYIESEYLGDRQGFLETAKNIVLDPFNPIGSTKNEVLSAAVPQAIKPAIELGLNKDIYTGRDIIPENLKGLPANEQAYENTQQSYKDIGKLFGISPLQVRKVVAGYGAGGVEGALATVDQIRGKESGNRAVTEQILGRFFAPDGGGQVKSTFYETYGPLKDKKEAVSRKITEAIKSGDIDKANQLANQINDEVEAEKKRLRETYGRFESDLTPLYDRIDYLKFPVENGRLKRSSIAYRQKSK